MPESNVNFAKTNSIDYDRVKEVNQSILRRQRKAQIVRLQQQGNERNQRTNLTEEFFAGLNLG